MQRRTALAEFSQQVPPLVLDLAAGGAQTNPAPNRGKLAPIECVTTRLRLVGDRMEKGVDGRARRGMGPEALELRVVPVASRGTAQHRAGEQRLAPQRHKSSRVEVPGMQCPESHVSAAVPRRQRFAHREAAQGSAMPHDDFLPDEHEAATLEERPRREAGLRERFHHASGQQALFH